MKKDKFNQNYGYQSKNSIQKLWFVDTITLKWKTVISKYWPSLLFYEDKLLKDKLLMSLLIEVQSQHFMLIKNPSTKEFYVILLSKHTGVSEILMPVCNY